GEHVTINSVLYTPGDPTAQLEACNTKPTTSHFVNQDGPFQCKCFDDSTALVCTGNQAATTWSILITAVAVCGVVVFSAVILYLVYRCHVLRRAHEVQPLPAAAEPLPSAQPRPRVHVEEHVHFVNTDNVPTVHIYDVVD
ncbi:unnamed protein product, partial [Meganyctiphanes norvegica]